MIAWMLAGCMTLDFAVFPAETVDAYVLDFPDTVPASAVEEVRFTTPDGIALAGVWLHQDPPAPPMIFFHGYTANLDAYTDRMAYYYGWGRYDVFCFDFRGYGTSDGVADEAGVLETDGVAAADYVARATGTPLDDIPWITLSLGASVAAHSNDERLAQAVVYESMYASADDVLDDSVGMDLPQGWFLEGDYDNVEAISKVQSPVFLIHGTEDTFIPPTHVGLLYDAAPDNPKQLWQPEGVGHSDIIDVLPDEYRDRVLAFLDAQP